MLLVPPVMMITTYVIPLHSLEAAVHVVEAGLEDHVVETREKKLTTDACPTQDQR